MSGQTIPTWYSAVFVPVCQLFVALLVSSLVVLIVGENPWHALKVLVNGALNSSYGIPSTLYYSTNFIFTGLAVAVAFHAGLFNIGGEGQAYVAGLGVVLVCLGLDAYLPWYLLAPIAILAACLAGACWAAIPGWLQAHRGSHVVVTTIMFNFIGASLVSYFLVELLRDEKSLAPESRYLNADSVLPKVHEIVNFFGGSMLSSLFNLSFIFALIAALLVWFLLWRTRLGYAIRVTGQSHKVAEYAGIDTKKIIIIAMLISGALAGMMAVNEIYGAHNRLVLGFTNGFGFIGIAVSLMGRNHPIGVIFAALLFGALYQGGTDLQFEIPRLSPELILVIQGLVVFFTAASGDLIRRPLDALWLKWQSQREEKA